MNIMKIYKRIFIVGLLLIFSFSSFAQYEKLQAAFIYNFTKYMEWPAGYRNGDFVVGVINSPEMLSALNSMVSGKLVGAQKIVVKSFGSVNAVSDCHLVYLPKKSSNDLGTLKGKLSGKSTLIVTNKDGLAQNGADINFILVGGKLSFEMNKSNINGKNINVNSRLEQLAGKVY